MQGVEQVKRPCTNSLSNNAQGSWRVGLPHLTTFWKLMHKIRRCGVFKRQLGGLYARHLRSSISTSTRVDEHGIPLQATWSVNDLLSSYPKPTISPATLKRMHELSALIPPPEGTPQHARLTSEMEDLVKLVEAVKMVEVDGHYMEADVHGVPDGRIWAQSSGIPLTRHSEAVEDEDTHGRALLKHAQRVENGLYVVPRSSKRA